MDQKKRKYKAFVAGLPHGVSQQQIEHYFSKFGYISGVELTYHGSTSSPKDGESLPSSENQSTKYCIVTVTKKTTYDKILGTPDQIFMGRSIICRPFLSGHNLKKSHKKLNSRRVLLRFVPSCVSQTQLKAKLEQLFGVVNVLFPYKNSETPQDYLTPTWCHTYSVMFNSQKECQKAIQMESFDIDSPFSSKPQTIVIERYDPNKRKKNRLRAKKEKAYRLQETYESKQTVHREIFSSYSSGLPRNEYPDSSEKKSWPSPLLRKSEGKCYEKVESYEHKNQAKAETLGLLSSHVGHHFGTPTLGFARSLSMSDFSSMEDFEKTNYDGHFEARSQSVLVYTSRKIEELKIEDAVPQKPVSDGFLLKAPSGKMFHTVVKAK